MSVYHLMRIFIIALELIVLTGGSLCVAPTALSSVFLHWSLPSPHCRSAVKYWVILLCTR